MDMGYEEGHGREIGRNKGQETSFCKKPGELDTKFLEGRIWTRDAETTVDCIH